VIFNNRPANLAESSDTSVSLCLSVDLSTVMLFDNWDSEIYPNSSLNRSIGLLFVLGFLFPNLGMHHHHSLPLQFTETCPLFRLNMHQYSVYT
jgi:hypothetical protein